MSRGSTLPPSTHTYTHTHNPKPVWRYLALKLLRTCTGGVYPHTCKCILINMHTNASTSIFICSYIYMYMYLCKGDYTNVLYIHKYIVYTNVRIHVHINGSHTANSSRSIRVTFITYMYTYIYMNNVQFITKPYID